MTTTVQPAKRFRLGSITLTVWPNSDRAGRTYYTASLGRSFRDSQGKWADTGSLRPADLPVVRTLTAKALDWITANPPGDSSDEAEAPDPEPHPEARLLRLLHQLERQLTH
ncbi:MAG: hypothetical protein SFZ23_10485 [Planctomycetota bacterium]|nr:hypothetical protein [Planctomycetota bacterium]